MKFRSLLIRVLLSLSITVFVPVQVDADSSPNIRTTENLNQISKSIILLVKQGQKYGSGFIVGRRNSSYYFLTSSHVVNSGDVIQITAPDQRVYTASILTRNLPDLDLAILEFKSNQTYSIATIADYKLSEVSSISAGANIYVSGWNKNSINSQVLFTCGIALPDRFSLFLRQDPINDGYELAYTNVTQVGLSGGPILDNQGRVIGIHGRAEGEELEGVGSLNLGLSLGIPSWKFLQVIRNSRIQLPLLIDKNPPENLNMERSAGHNPCVNNISPPATSDSTTEWANYANSMLRIGKFVDALSAYDKAASRNVNGELYQIWYGRGLTLILLNRPNEALKNFNQALQLWNQLPVDRNQARRLNIAKALILRYQGMLLAGNQNYQESLYTYDQALKIDPQNTSLEVLRASVLSTLGKNQDAVDAYTKAIQVSPRPEIFLARSDLYFKLGQYDLAIRDLDSALKLSPFDPQIYAIRGSLRKRVGDVQGAERDHKQVYELTSELARSFNSRFDYAGILVAQAEIYAGDIDSGVDKFLQAATRRLGISETLITNLLSGVTSQLRGMLDQADDSYNADIYVDVFMNLLENLRQTHEVSGESEVTVSESMMHLMKAMYLLNTSDLNQASEKNIASAYSELEEAIRLHSGNEEIYVAYAMRSAFRIRSKDEQGAVGDFEKAQNMTPSLSDIYFIRGTTSIALGNFRASITDLQAGSQIAYEQGELDKYQMFMSIIDRLQNLN